MAQLQTSTESAEQQRNDGGDIQPQGDYTGPLNAGPEEPVADLPEPTVSALADLCKKLDARDRQARLQQVARCQKARFFERGQQYLNRQRDDELFSVNPVTTPLWQQSGDNPPRATLNIYLGYLKVWMSTFSQTPCGVRFEPNDPMIERQVEAAKEAEAARKIINKINPAKVLQMKVARYIWTDGLAVLYVRNVTDGSKFGVDKDGQPRSYPEIEVGGALEWKVPIAAGSFDEWDYCRYQREISLARAKADYRAKKDKIAASTGGLGGDLDLSRQARISIQEGITTPGGAQKGQSGDAAATSVTRSVYWLRPAAFELLGANDAEEAKRIFPRGARLVFIGETYVESRDEDMADHVSPLVVGEGDGFNRPGLGDPEIDVQEMFNNGMNISKDCFERTVPHRYMDQELIPAESINQQKNEYGYVHPVDMPSDSRPLADHFHEENTVNPPALLVQYLEQLQGPLSQFLTGQQPSVFGGQMGKDDRVGVYQQARAMALGLMGIVWIPYKTRYAVTMRQAVKILADAYGQGTQLAVMVNGENGKPEVVKVNVDNLKGDFLAYPDTDESYPESWGEKKAQFQELVVSSQKNPELGQILLHPDNLRLAKRMLALDDLVIPGADACDKQSQEIEEMENQPPVPNPQFVSQIQQAQVSGMVEPDAAQQMLAAIPPVSSVDLGKYDDHAAEFATCVRWLNSRTGQQAKRDNPAWYQNVELHADAHKAEMEKAKSEPQQKPPSESMNFKDLPPGGKAQMAAQAGITLDADELAAHENQKQAAQMATTLPMQQ